MLGIISLLRRRKDDIFSRAHDKNIMFETFCLCANHLSVPPLKFVHQDQPMHSILQFIVRKWVLWEMLVIMMTSLRYTFILYETFLKILWKVESGKMHKHFHLEK